MTEHRPDKDEVDPIELEPPVSDDPSARLAAGSEIRRPAARPEGARPEPVRGAITFGRGVKCRTCGYSLAGLTTRVCPECGTNAVTGENEGKLREAQGDPRKPSKPGPEGMRTCPKCKYDLSGIQSPHCPECGLVLTKRGLARLRSEQVSHDYWKKMWITTGVMIGVSVGLLVLFVLLGVIEAKFAILHTGIATGGFLVAGVVLLTAWIGLNETWTGTLMKLVAIGVTSALVYVLGVQASLVFHFICGVTLLLFPAPVLATALLHKLLDYDWEEGAAVTGAAIVLVVIGWYFGARYL